MNQSKNNLLHTNHPPTNQILFNPKD